MEGQGANGVASKEEYAQHLMYQVMPSAPYLIPPKAHLLPKVSTNPGFANSPDCTTTTRKVLFAGCD